MSLGAKGFTLFRKVTLPMLSPAIFASAMLTFVFSFLSFSIPLILGGYKYSTIEVAIFTAIITMLDFRTGVALRLFRWGSVSPSCTYTSRASKSTRKLRSRGF